MSKLDLFKFIVSQFDEFKDYGFRIFQINGEIIKKNGGTSIASTKISLLTKFIGIRYRMKIINPKNISKLGYGINKELVRYLELFDKLNEENYFIWVILHELGHSIMFINLANKYKIKNNKEIKYADDIAIKHLSLLTNTKKENNSIIGSLNCNFGYTELYANNFAYKEFPRIYKLVHVIYHDRLKYKLWKKNYEYKKFKVALPINMAKGISRNSKKLIVSYNENAFSYHTLCFYVNKKNFDLLVKNLDKNKYHKIISLISDLNNEEVFDNKLHEICSLSDEKFIDGNMGRNFIKGRIDQIIKELDLKIIEG